MELISNGYRFRRGTGSPFDALSNPSVDLGGSMKTPVQWCPSCQQAVETQSASYNQHHVWGQKHWCRRCGAVVASAVYFHAGSIATIPSTLFYKAVEWAKTPETYTL